MKKLIYFILLCSVFVFPQKDEKQNVELPDFIITGTEKVTVDKVQKVDPDLIPIISNDFLKPSFSPEELELKSFPDPLKKDLNFYDSVHYSNGYIDAAAGLNNLPSGKIYYSSAFSGGLFQGSISGINVRPYEPNADRIGLKSFIQTDFYTPSGSSFLPGTEYLLYGGYALDSYKMFASAVPTARRTIHDITAKAGIRNFQSQNFQTDITFTGIFTNVKNQNSINDYFANNILVFNGYANYQTDNFLIGVESSYKFLTITNDSVKNINSGIFSILPRVGLRVSDIIKADIGIFFSKGVGRIYSSPYFSAALKLDKKASLFFEYNPHAELNRGAEYLKVNPYLNLKNFDNIYTTYTGDMKISVKYEYEKYFQINGGIKFLSAADYYYFVPDANKGYFALSRTDARIFGGFLDLLYHLGPYGYFYGRIDADSYKDDSGAFLPYNSALRTKSAYGFTLKRINLDTEVGITFNSPVYTDIQNTFTKKLDSYLDLNAKFTYHYKPGFLLTVELSNMIGYGNDKWSGYNNNLLFRYKELPFNISAGLRIIL